MTEMELIATGLYLLGCMQGVMLLTVLDRPVPITLIVWPLLVTIGLLITLHTIIYRRVFGKKETENER